MARRKGPPHGAVTWKRPINDLSGRLHRGSLRGQLERQTEGGKEEQKTNEKRVRGVIKT